jgi:glutamate dehydrogenase/leucine dehydrogenase
VAQLERKVGQQALEIDFLKGCLQSMEQQRQLQAVTGKPLSTGRSKSREADGKP